MIREFEDFDGGVNSYGETWIFLGHSFAPHDDGLSLLVSLDGEHATQENVPVPTDITLTRVILAQNGAIDFIGVRTSTLETVRGSIEPGSTSVEIATTGVLDPMRIVTFTRINGAT